MVTECAGEQKAQYGSKRNDVSPFVLFPLPRAAILVWSITPLLSWVTPCPFPWSADTAECPFGCQVSKISPKSQGIRVFLPLLETVLVSVRVEPLLCLRRADCHLQDSCGAEGSAAL